jgi:hypothetical protein
MTLEESAQAAFVGFEAESRQMIGNLLPALVLLAHRADEFKMRRELRLKWFSGHGENQAAVGTVWQMLALIGS